jgi:dTMP kinase
MRRHPQFIVIEGLDGSGKSTQIALLTEYFQAQGIETRFIHFPRHNDGVFGTLIAQFLRGEFGAVDGVHPQLVALLFAEDRRDFAGQMQEWLDQGCTVLCDRYVMSNIAFQCAKLKDPSEKAALRKWILDFEYSYNRIPKPDVSLYLDVPFAFTEHALTARLQAHARDYLDGKADIHEQDFSLQRAVKREYEAMVDMDAGIRRIACANDGQEMRPIPDIHRMILAAIGQ